MFGTNGFDIKEWIINHGLCIGEIENRTEYWYIFYIKFYFIGLQDMSFRHYFRLRKPTDVLTLSIFLFSDETVALFHGKFDIHVLYIPTLYSNSFSEVLLLCDV